VRFDTRQKRILSVSQHTHRPWGPNQPHIQWVPGSLSPGHEADPVTSIQCRGQESVIPPLPPHVFMEWCLIKYRDNFTFCVLNSVLPCNLYQIKSQFLKSAAISNVTPCSPVEVPRHGVVSQKIVHITAIVRASNATSVDRVSSRHPKF
jgi:hypothetical protein